MANAGIGIIIALGIGIAATLAVFLFRQSGPQAYESPEYARQDRPRDYDSPNSWHQVCNRRNVPPRNRRRNGTASRNRESACSICMVEGNEEFISLPCSHEFHKQCITRWQEESKTCPICRSNF